MSFRSITFPLGVGTSLVGYGGYSYLDRKFPAQGNAFKPGQKIEIIDKHGNNVDKVVIGYFGASNKTFDKINKEQGLYFGSKKIAQGYAKNRAKEDEDPEVAVVVGDRLPQATKGDLGTPRFPEGPEPLTPEFIRKAKVKLVHKETVTTETQLGATGTMKRIMKEYNNKK